MSKHRLRKAGALAHRNATMVSLGPFRSSQTGILANRDQRRRLSSFDPLGKLHYHNRTDGFRCRRRISRHEGHRSLP